MGVLVAGVCLLGAMIANASSVTVALSGNAAPGGGSFASFAPIELSLSRYAAFTAALSDVPAGSERAIFWANEADLRLVVREGTAFTGSGGGTFSQLGNPIVHSNNAVTFRSIISGTDNGMYRATIGGISVTLNQSARGNATTGTWSNMTEPAGHASGYAAFRVDESATVQRIHRVNDVGAVQQVARTGPAAVFNVASVNFGTFGLPSIGAGTVAFRASVGTLSEGIFSTLNGSIFTQIARRAEPAPGGGVFSQLRDPVVNANGTVAFRASAIGVADAIYRGLNDSNLTRVAASDTSAPGGGTFGSFNDPVIAGGGHVAFRASLSGGSTEGIWRTDAVGTTLQQIIRTGQSPAAGGGGTITAVSDPAIADGGQVAYRAQLGIVDAALYISDGTESLHIARTGMPLAGSSVVDVQSNFAPARGGRSPINGEGQVLYWASLADGRQGVFLYTPELHWRHPFSGNWNDLNNWTLGLRPSQVHDVVIDPPNSVFISGPTGFDFAFAKSLQLGGGGGSVTLAVDSLIVAGVIQIDSRSALVVRPNLTGSLHAQSIVNDGALAVGSFSGTTPTVFASVGEISGEGRTSVMAAAQVTATHVRQDALTVIGQLTIPANGTSAATSVVKALNLTTGTLDLNDNDLIINYTDDSPAGAVRVMLRNGWNNGSWNGASGILSSTSRNTPGYAIGMSEAATMFGSFPAIFSGQVVDDTSLILTPARYGDANLDGTVNLQDFNRLASHFGQSGRIWSQGDFNYDGMVNLQDFNLLASMFGLGALQQEPSPADWWALMSSIPEPHSLIWTAIILSRGLASRRRALEVFTSIVVIIIINGDRSRE